MLALQEYSKARGKGDRLTHLLALNSRTLHVPRGDLLRRRLGLVLGTGTGGGGLGVGKEGVGRVGRFERRRLYFDRYCLGALTIKDAPESATALAFERYEGHTLE